MRRGCGVEQLLKLRADLGLLPVARYASEPPFDSEAILVLVL